MSPSPLIFPGIVYFDMDMVLADAEGEYFRITGEAYDHTNPWPDAKREAFYQQHGTFFRDLKWIKGSRLLLDYVSAYLRTGICSSVSKHLPERCKEHKLDWLSDHGVLARLDPVVITPPRANKGEHAKPGDILLDDYIVNVNRWRKAGGIGIQFQNALQAFDELHQHIPAGPNKEEIRRLIEKELV
jgi:hypothetical protein